MMKIPDEGVSNSRECHSRFVYLITVGAIAAIWIIIDRTDASATNHEGFRTLG